MYYFIYLFSAPQQFEQVMKPIQKASSKMSPKSHPHVSSCAQHKPGSSISHNIPPHKSSSHGAGGSHGSSSSGHLSGERRSGVHIKQVKSTSQSPIKKVQKSGSPSNTRVKAEKVDPTLPLESQG